MDTAVKSKKAVVQKKCCVACGACVKACPKDAIEIRHGASAESDESICVGCGVCAKACPADAIVCGSPQAKVKHWYDYLWLVELLYFALGFYNILFAWLGLIFFATPLIISIVTGGKTYCNRYCGRGQLFERLGNHLSMKNDVPKLIKSGWFRYGFLLFFLAMFGNMLYTTYLVFAGTKTLAQFVTVFWHFKLPWHWAHYGGVAEWVAQFSFGFYSVMLTATLLGLITMVLFKPRTWCVYCPMGTMTQLISKLRKPNPMH